jgi:hypothetical protein
MFILPYVQMFVQEGFVMRKSASYWNEEYLFLRLYSSTVYGETAAEVYCDIFELNT